MIDLSHVTADVSPFHRNHVAAVFLKLFRNNLIFQPPSHNPQEFLNNLLVNYSHPERFYHTLRHISEALLALEYQTRLLGKDYRIAQMAIIYHDVLLYNFQNGLSVEVQNSEPSSAYFFVKQLGPYLDDIFVRDVHRTILATWYSKGIKPTNRVEEAVVNADMFGFCLPPEEFLQQNFRVWRESAGPNPDKEFFDKQLNFLKSLLKKEYIITPLTEKHEQLNEQARTNIQGSIEFIQGLVSDIPEPIITSIDEWYDGTPLTVPTHPEDDITDSYLLDMDAEDYFKVYTKFHQAQKYVLTPLIAFYRHSEVKVIPYVLGEEIIIMRNKEKLDMDFIKITEQVKSEVTAQTETEEKVAAIKKPLPPSMEKNGLNLPLYKETDFAEGLYKNIEELETRVSQWYTTNRSTPLSVYLGVTDESYKLVAFTGDTSLLKPLTSV